MLRGITSHPIQVDRERRRAAVARCPWTRIDEAPVQDPFAVAHEDKRERVRSKIVSDLRTLVARRRLIVSVADYLPHAHCTEFEQAEETERQVRFASVFTGE